MAIEIKVDLDRLTLDDVIALEEGRSMKTMRDILARFVVEGGEYAAHDAAKKTIGGLTMRELKTVATQFAEAVKGAEKDALPPNGSDKS